MKTKLDHLLYCLGEECGEVQQIAGKAGRFGIKDMNPNTRELNIEMIHREITDILAVYEMICSEVGCDSTVFEVAKQSKKDRVTYYMDYARKQGELEVNVDG